MLYWIYSIQWTQSQQCKAMQAQVRRVEYGMELGKKNTKQRTQQIECGELSQIKVKDKGVV